MEDFLTSERFEQMAKEYNAKYRQANILEKLFDKKVEESAEICDGKVLGKENMSCDSIKNVKIGENAEMGDKNSCEDDLIEQNSKNEATNGQKCEKICEDKLTDEQKVEIADILWRMMSLIKICEARMSRNLIFFGKNDMGEKLLEKIHKTALENDILFEKGQKHQFFWGNDRNFVLKLIKIEKIFAKDEKIAKVQCLCDIHEAFLDYVGSFCERF